MAIFTRIFIDHKAYLLALHPARYLSIRPVEAIVDGTLDKAQFQAAGAPERFFVTFAIDNRRARFEVTANSVQHPIQLRELREFTCPEGL
jgi:hypothetical protein